MIVIRVVASYAVGAVLVLSTGPRLSRSRRSWKWRSMPPLDPELVHAEEVVRWCETFSPSVRLQFEYINQVEAEFPDGLFQRFVLTGISRRLLSGRWDVWPLPGGDLALLSCLADSPVPPEVPPKLGEF